MSTESEQVGSSNPEDYGLDHPPGEGIWVFEGKVIIAWSKGGHPEDPPEYDSNMSWEGERRPPNDEELARWRGFRATDVTEDYKGEGSTDAKRVEDIVDEPKPATQHRGPVYDSPSRSDFCDCGKHVSECCCGESFGRNHHPSGRAYDDEDYEQFYK